MTIKGTLPYTLLLHRAQFLAMRTGGPSVGFGYYAVSMVFYQALLGQQHS